MFATAAACTTAQGDYFEVGPSLEAASTEEYLQSNHFVKLTATPRTHLTVTTPSIILLFCVFLPTCAWLCPEQLS
jgi:hypothetical protein